MNPTTPVRRASAAPPDAAAQSWLGFRLDGQLYAAPLASVSEVIRPGELTPVPGAAPDLLGIRHLRGRIVPVMDGRLRLGLPARTHGDDAEARIVMLVHGSHQVGLYVDAIGELLAPAVAEVAPPPPGRARRDDDPVHGVLAWRGGFVALLDVRRLCRLPADDGA
ncbi:chemotaxis protein CheW [Frateuria sp. Soil773]|uniref:chemotaxis protein CheW n=1 Tax=Frateuria sp. Soil773 TaxID=1736407 RepID=UPI0006F768AE|nr:chemotaxis protein CheW [Frateuria sp. Soil773]KRE90929.1 chemotaxis protein CheW [Frateuria sp. Soil773]